LLTEYCCTTTPRGTVPSASSHPLKPTPDHGRSLPPALQGAAAQAARQAFVDGLSAGSVVAAAGTAAAAALAFLPAYAKALRSASTAAAPPRIRASARQSHLRDQDPEAERPIKDAARRRPHEATCTADPGRA
jgi:hypothetical protein